MKAQGVAMFYRAFPAKNGKRIYLSGHDLESDGGVVDCSVPPQSVPPLFERVDFSGVGVARNWEGHMRLGFDQFTFKVVGPVKA